ncbi:tetratricopeptide repeat protein 27 [Nerophis lumbriciformis]|uniref:tetratricopeptide repeat protein 27 n=1 Tax=Nerophis lumbriciformis TaxID=546530 RepID=UPI002ADFC2AA|nr:tetratricopeptide repeat protein 27-like [Nerophis lumbriciformis]XP_061820609.1 tetratricopeptide repeat protein 27-like [Nerophis lumbriciformis]
MTLVDVQLSILRGFLTPSEATEWKQNIYTIPVAGSLLEYLMNGDFKAVLRSTSELVLLVGDCTCSEGEDIEAYLERQILLYLDGGEDGDRNNRELVVMVLAVSCLHMFVQSNWTGPSLFIELSDILPSALLSSQPQSMVESIHSCLLLDGESVYSLVANPFLLLLARVILTKCSSKMSSLQLLPWWTLRYINLHQQILEACSQQLLNLALTSMEEVLKYKSLFSEQRNLSIQFHLECVYCSLAYYEYSTAKEHIKKAQELSMLDINMTGALGKRTYFQEKYLAQLILEVKRKQDQLGNAVTEPSPSPTPKTLLPKDCSLGDDTVLDKLNLAEPDQYELPDLSAEDQALILGVCTDFQKNNPVHKLTQEELLAFTSCLLSQPKFWAVEMTAVCLRTKLEKGSSRCVERAMMQMQAVADHFEDTNCPFTERLKVFYCCHAPTKWVIQKQLAALLIDLGCTSSALLIYEKLQLWEDVIVCWERLGQHGKAEELVRQELAKKETPSLYCLLGDILRDHQYYDKAWDLSGHRSARAMRSKALLHLRQKEFQQCVDCFEKALKINALQLGVWFSLGCAYLALQSYEGAARAFQRCVGLEPDNAEAWNNLSTAYIRLRNKNKAFLTLQEAIKCNYEHWQIWENFIVVSIDIGAFSEAIKAYHRLMDLRDSYKDIQIIQILVRAVVEKLTDNQGEQAASLQPKLRELLGRVSSRHSSDPEIWRQYAVLYGGGHSALPEDNDKAQQFLSKAFRCEIQAAGWEKETCLFKNVIRRAINMGEVSISCSEKKKNSAEALQMLSSARLSLKSLLTKAEQTHTDVASGAIHADLQDDVVELEQLVTQLQELCAQLRAQSQ